MSRRAGELPPIIRVPRDRHGRFLCIRMWPRGWYCTRGLHLDGPCALLPRWWNLRGRWRWTR